MILNDREIRILEKFYNNSELNIVDLAKEFKVSERMIRYNIERINDVLKFIKISPIKKSQHGSFILNISDKTNKIFEIIKKLEGLDKSKRFILIQFLVLYSKERITISYLTQYFEVSRGTIINYIKEIKKNLKLKGLDIVNNKGLKIVGNKDVIEKYKFNVLYENIRYIYKNDETEFSIKLADIIIKTLDKNFLNKIKSFVNEIINDFKVNINDVNYRIICSKLLKIFLEKNNLKDITLNVSEINYVKEKFEKLKLLQYANENMMCQISDLISWVKSYEKINDINIDLLVKNIINNVESKINKNISRDKLLFEFLLQHIKALIYRISNGYKLEANTLDENNKKEDEFYCIIKKSMYIVNDVLNKQIEDDEIHLLKIHFLASIERMKRLELKPIEVAIVTSLGNGSNRILVDNIQNRFFIKVSYIGSIFNLNKILRKNKNIKYILTTINLDEKEYKDYTIVNISPIITENDKEKLLKLGFKSNTNKILLSNIVDIVRRSTNDLDYEKLITELLENFGDKIVNDIDIKYDYEDILKIPNILFDYKALDIEDAITKGCSILEGEYTDSSYTKDVLNIFNNFNSNIIRYNGVILPHTKNNGNVFKTGVSIITLKEPVIITQTNEYIDTIVTFSIKDEKKSLDTISDVINMIFSIEFKNILIAKDKMKIIEYLKTYKMIDRR